MLIALFLLAEKTISSVTVALASVLAVTEKPQLVLCFIISAGPLFSTFCKRAHANK